MEKLKNLFNVWKRECYYLLGYRLEKYYLLLIIIFF